MTAFWQPVGDRELRVGLAGLGSMGRNHLRVISSRPNARLAAVADPVPGGARRGDRPDRRRRLRRAARDDREADLDAVVIAAPTTAHLPLALAAIGRGIAVLVEKPLAADGRGGPGDRGRVAAPPAFPSRSATSSGSTRPSASSAGCSTRALAVDRLRDHDAAAPARSRPGSATSA